MKLTIKDLKNEVIKVAKERPDFVYSQQEGFDAKACSYVGPGIGVDGGEGCIVGQALVRLGVPEEHLREIEADGIAVSIEDMFASQYLETWFEDALSTPELSWITVAQNGQDRGLSWIECVNKADEREALRAADAERSGY